MRNALVPQVTGLAMSLGSIFNGAIITEQVFGYPGIGTLLISAVHTGDYSLVIGIASVSIVAVSVAVLIIDLLYPLLDPRVKVVVMFAILRDLLRYRREFRLGAILTGFIVAVRGALVRLALSAAGPVRGAARRAAVLGATGSAPIRAARTCSGSSPSRSATPCCSASRSRS